MTTTPRRRLAVGKPLPSLSPFGVQLDSRRDAGKAVLVCFWDREQRPSRHCAAALRGRAEQLSGTGRAVVLVHRTPVEDGALRKWREDEGVTFAVGAVKNNVRDTLRSWSARSLPWLILTDRKHVVRAAGFGVEELDSKLGEIAAKQQERD